MPLERKRARKQAACGCMKYAAQAATLNSKERTKGLIQQSWTHVGVLRGGIENIDHEWKDLTAI